MQTITHAQHYKAHKLVTEYQRIQNMQNSQVRLSAITQWQLKMQQYGQAISLKRAG